MTRDDMRTDATLSAIALIRAIVSYRRLLAQALKLLSGRHGERRVLAFYRVDQLRPLVDANDDRYVDLPRLAPFIKAAEAPTQYSLILSTTRKALNSDTSIQELSRLLRSLGEPDLSDDILFFLEHRIRSNRKAILDRSELAVAGQQVSIAEVAIRQRLAGA